jgi:hypothetical protein
VSLTRHIFRRQEKRYKNMTTNPSRFDPRELCSRKLWQLVNTAEDQAKVNEQELQQAIAELSTRRHYLTELQQTGKLGEDKAGA